jgi:hypothetical protein
MHMHMHIERLLEPRTLKDLVDTCRKAEKGKYTGIEVVDAAVAQIQPWEDKSKNASMRGKFFCVFEEPQASLVPTQGWDEAYVRARLQNVIKFFLFVEAHGSCRGALTYRTWLQEERAVWNAYLPGT